MSEVAKTPLKEKRNILELDLGNESGLVHFTALPELEEWMGRERSAVNWIIEQRLHKDAPIAEAYSRINESLTQMESHLNDAKRFGPEKDFGGHLAQIKALVEGGYRKLGFLPGSPIRALVEKLKSSEPKVAAYAMAAKYNTLRWPPPNPEAWRGVAQYLALEGVNANASALAAVGESLEALRRDWVAFVDKSRQEQQLIHNEAVQISKEFRQSLSDQQEALKKQLDASAASLEGATKKHEEDLAAELTRSKEAQANLEKAFTEHMRLKSAVTYWQEQEQKHNIRALIFGGLSILWAAISVGCLLLGGPVLFQSDYDPYEAVTLLQQPPWKLLLVALAVTLMIWLQRILVRITLSHVHLGTDSGERTTIAKAYMALVKEGAAPADDRRDVVFAALFRPSSTGIVKDDAVPPTALEWLSRFTSGKH